MVGTNITYAFLEHDYIKVDKSVSAMASCIDCAPHTHHWDPFFNRA
jgi:hypothetical protein